MTLPRRAGGASPWPAALTIVAISAVILIVLNPGWVFSATTPTGGDMGAHVFGPAYLRDHLLARGQILGWSNDWFAGFPAFYFYFPLPSLVIVLLDVVLPYGVAFKVVTIMGLLATPPAAYFLARSMRLPTQVSIVAAASGAVSRSSRAIPSTGATWPRAWRGSFRIRGPSPCPCCTWAF